MWMERSQMEAMFSPGHITDDGLTKKEEQLYKCSEAFCTPKVDEDLKPYVFPVVVKTEPRPGASGFHCSSSSSSDSIDRDVKPDFGSVGTVVMEEFRSNLMLHLEEENPAAVESEPFDRKIKRNFEVPRSENDDGRRAVENKYSDIEIKDEPLFLFPEEQEISTRSIKCSKSADNVVKEELQSELYPDLSLEVKPEVENYNVKQEVLEPEGEPVLNRSSQAAEGMQLQISDVWSLCMEQSSNPSKERISSVILDPEKAFDPHRGKAYDREMHSKGVNDGYGQKPKDYTSTIKTVKLNTNMEVIYVTHMPTQVSEEKWVNEEGRPVAIKSSVPCGFRSDIVGLSECHVSNLNLSRAQSLATSVNCTQSSDVTLPQLLEESHAGQNDASLPDGPEFVSDKKTNAGEKPKFKCEVCGKRVSCKRSHQRTHTGEKPYKCKVCGAQFTECGKLHRHNRIHTGEKPHKCEVCDKRFIRSCHLKIHAKTHTKQKPYKCEVCGAEFTNRLKLHQHNLIHIKPYKCEVCDAEFTDKRQLHRHNRIHLGEKPYKCELCDKRFTQRMHLASHKRIHTGEKPFKCEICGLSFAYSCTLKSHKSMHSGENPYICEVCGATFPQICKLNRHKEIHTDEKRYKCEVCDKRFTLRSSLRGHKKTHTGEKPYMCEVCGAKFVESGKLDRHKRIHTGEKPYKCEVCDKRFAQSGSLKSHKRTHTGEKPYPCEVCGKRFSQHGSRNIHKMMHTGEKPFKCEVCGSRFTTIGSLKTHKTIHTGEKPFKCEVCGSRFTTIGSLKTHKTIHTGEKHFKCEVCGSKFSTSSSLRSHKRKHTGEKPYQCGVCGKWFVRNGDLNRHKRRHCREKTFI